MKCDVRNQSANAYVLPLRHCEFYSVISSPLLLSTVGILKCQMQWKRNGKVSTQVHNSSALILFCLVTVGLQGRTGRLRKQLWCKCFLQKLGLFIFAGGLCNSFSPALPNAN